MPYLHALGITDIYASPLFKARQESEHGYDVTDPTQLNPALGGADMFAGLARALRRHDMGLLLDIVPNHMAACTENPWWLDVLQFGPDSPFASFFDINWQSGQPGPAGKVLLPVLNSYYGEALEKGDLSLIWTGDGFRLSYNDKQFPLHPGTYSEILQHREKEPAANLGPDHPGRIQLVQLLNLLKHLPPRTDSGFAAVFRETRDKLRELYNNYPEIKAFIDENLRIFNGVPGDPRSFNKLDRLLDRQAYRIAFWRVANREINYRRFFNITDMVSLRMEDENVFAATHALVLELARAGQVTGLRIDHVDGLHDPLNYLRRLQEQLNGAGDNPGFYVVVEKILSGDEELPEDWPVYGTTGYDFLRTLNELFVNSAGIALLDRVYARLRGSEPDFSKVEYARKRRVMTELFGGEMHSLARQLVELAKRDRHGRDITPNQLAQALVEVTACFPVYRTYTRDYKVSDRDRTYIEQAVSEAIKRHRAIKPAAGFLRRVLLLEFGDWLPENRRRDWLDFVMRWQQFTGPIMAKGLEDTAMYVYNRLISLNEVGGEPHSTGITVDEFHRRNRARQERWPHTMNTTSTHDTKRSEDVRARINLLSEIPAVWVDHLEKWRRWNRNKKQVVDDQPVPDDNVELLIYQTLVGAWPLAEDEESSFKERLKEFLIKASREAKVYTRWLEPDTGYEEALVNFAMSILEPGQNNEFLQDFKRFREIIAYYGAISSLAQVLLKITSPGVPDIYQGMESWNFSLVDPDNRRPVDFQNLAAQLGELQRREAGDLPGLVVDLLKSWKDGRLKQFLTYKALHFRREHRRLFASGEYLPVRAGGLHYEHVCAFARRHGHTWALAAVPRMPARLHLQSHWPEMDDTLLNELPKERLLLPVELWGNNDLALPDEAPRAWRNVLTGETVDAPDAKLPLVDVFNNFPVALLAGE